MIRNYLAAALRNLVRNKLYAAINIAGLTAGFAAALLIALFVRDELTYDHYFPGYEHIYLIAEQVQFGARAPAIIRSTDSEFAAMLRLDFPFIENTARMATSGQMQTSIHVADRNSVEDILWADPNIFEILKFKPISGDIDSALSKPDSIVLTRALARKYFGNDDPLGKIVEIRTSDAIERFTATTVSSELFTVTAVIEDLPYNVHLKGGAIASGKSTMSPLAYADANPVCLGCIQTTAMTYLKLADQAAAQRVEADLPAFLQRHRKYEAGRSVELHLNSLASLHFAPGNGMKPRGSIDAVLAMGAIGLLILFTASVNFVNLMTARASRRATEVGVRKVSGATRRHLIVQFIGESVIYVLIGMGLGLGIATLSLPSMNGFLSRTIQLDLFSDPISGAFAVALAAVVGVLAGIYPAVVLSSFRPAAVLKAAAPWGPASAALRQSLVMLQFALLIGLLIATAVIERQIDFALTEAQRLNADEVLMVDRACRPEFKNAVAALPGVRATTCSYGEGLTDNRWTWQVTPPNGEQIIISAGLVDPGFFEFYGFARIAGRLFDGRASDAAPKWISPQMGVINETAARKLGFATPQAAIGQTLIFQGRPTPTEIVGVVSDFAADTIRNPVEPTFFWVDPAGYSPPTLQNEKKFEIGVLSIRLVGAQVPETLKEIDRLWKQTGSGQPISRFFLKQSIQARVADLTRQGTLFGIAASIAIFIALLGLFGMSVFVAEHRTKEIGIRKAMGATRRDILGLLLWQFAKPVLWANVVAWPVAYYVMHRWLQGFAYHIDLSPWIFVAASALALVIAVLTVSGHALLVARSQPAAALRYE